MNRLYESGDFSSSCSSDSDDGSTSDDDSNELGSNSSNGKQSAESGLHCRKPMRQNVLLKLQNREVSIDYTRPATFDRRCVPIALSVIARFERMRANWPGALLA